MRFRPRLLIGAAALIFLPFSDAATVPRHGAVALEETSAPDGLSVGDVVFITVPNAFWARLASRWSLPEYRHGHVGIVAEVGARGVVVIHAGGSPTRGEARVERSTWHDFVHGAIRADIFRPRDAKAAQAAAAAAAMFVKQRLTFDSDFSLDTRNALYCTEMAWRALSAGFHRDILPEKSHVLGRDAVLLRDLETSPFLRLTKTVKTEQPYD